VKQTDGFKIQLMDESDAYIQRSFNITEMTYISFEYSKIKFIKEGTEIFIYDINEQEYTYHVLNAPILMTSMENYSSSNNINVL